MMKVLFYSPYIPDHLGGGEKHFFDVATTVALKHKVYIGLPPSLISREKKSIQKIKEKYENFLNYSLDSVSFIASSISAGSIFEKMIETAKFDYVYYVTDGSFFISLAKKNNLHIQIPFTNSLNFWEKIKLNTWQIKNTNSEFTKKVIENNWRIKVDFVHNPMVSLTEMQPNKSKEKIILNVGRFFKQLHSKRQDVLVQFFKELIDSKESFLNNWKLVLVGSVEDVEYFQEVSDKIKGYPIEIKTNVSRVELISLYSKASIYWHAAGYDIDENRYPERVEHFGISTIEAMASGCVPVVINKGGQREILGDELKSLLWNSKKECLDITRELTSNSSICERYQQKVLQRVEKFSKQVFEKKLWEMF